MSREPEVVEAEVVDGGEIAQVSFDVDTAVLAGDVGAVERDVAAAHSALRQYGCDREVIATLDYAMAKNYEQALNAAIKAANESRKKLKGDFTAPVREVEAKFAALMRPVEDMRDAMRERRITCEELEKAKKRQHLMDYYAEFAPLIAVPQGGADKALVPFERIFDKRWLNKSMSVKKCEEAIGEACDRVAELERTFDAMEWAHRDECKAVMFATLSIEEAVRRDQALTGAEERCRAMDAARAETLRSMYETEATAEQARGIEPQPDPGRCDGDAVRHRRVVFAAAEFEFDATRAECAELAECMRRFGIKGSIKTIKEESDE